MFTIARRLWKIQDVKNTQRKSIVGRTGKILLIAVTALFALAIFLGFEWRPAKVVSARQADLISAIESRNKTKIRKLLADDYLDRWGFSADDATESIVDVGSQFLTLLILTDEQSLERDGERIVAIAELTAEGNAIGPVGNAVVRRINQLDAPFIFKWEKQSLFPTSWRVVEIDNPDLPGELYGYKPGDIRRALNGDATGLIE